MSQDKKLTDKRLSALWKDETVPKLQLAGNKYVLMSDLHLGDGGSADDFRENRNALVDALDHYQKNGYQLIVLGDTEEFWQFDLDEVRKHYNNTVYRKMRAFDDDHFHRVFGNHDLEWGALPDPARSDPERSAAASEALKLMDRDGRDWILMVHGHQGSTESDKKSWASRYWVRLFRKVEGIAKDIGLYGHSSATQSQIATDYERIMYSWAKKKKLMLICGHSHRAIFAAKSYHERLEEEIGDLQAEILANPGDSKLMARNRKKLQKLLDKLLEERQKGRGIDPAERKGEPLPCYFNTGCGLYTDGITVIEIANDRIKLVKWHKKPSGQRKYKVFQSGTLADYLKAIAEN